MKRKKCRTGTGMSGVSLSSYIPSPDEVIAKNDILQSKAELEAMSNPLVVGIQTITPILSSFLSSNPSMFQGTAKGKPTAKYGRRRMAYGGGMEEVEVEGGEVLEAPGQEAVEVQGPSHEQGGVPVDIPEGTNVFAEKVLGLDGRTMAQRKLRREKRKEDLLKRLDEYTGDKSVSNSVKRTLLQLEAEEQADLSEQEVAGAFANLLGMPHTEGEELAYGRRNRKLAYGDNPKKKLIEGTLTDESLNKRLLQEYATGQTLPENASFGNEDNKIKNLQTKIGVVSDGIAGPKTQKAWDNYLKQLDPEGYKEDNYYFPWEEKESESTWYHRLGLTPGGRQYKEAIAPLSTASPSPLALSNLKAPAPLGKEATDLQGSAEDFSGGVGFTPKQQSLVDTTDPFAMTTAEDWAKANPLPEGIKEPIPNSVGFTPSILKTDPITGEQKSVEEGEEPYIPTGGDFTKLIGNAFGAIAPLINTLANRAGDRPHPNYMKNVGDDAINTIDNMEIDASAMKDLQMAKNRSNASSARRASRQSARGINTMRALDLVLEMGVNQADLDIMTNFLNTKMGIKDKKANVQLQASQAKGQGAMVARDNTDRDRDQFYTNKGKNLANISQALQQTGKDLNDIQKNPIQLALLESMSEYYSVTKDGKFIPKGRKNKNKKVEEDNNG